MPESKLYAGTSGYDYPSWKPLFYPEKLARTKFLAHYATQLNLTESNFTFRQFLKPATCQKWIENTPADFRFSIKANQRITHFARLNCGQDLIDRFLDSVRPLGDAGRLAPILFQLPPDFQLSLPLLEQFLALLPTTLEYAFEFRHTSWFADSVYECLRARNVGLCLAESDKLETPEVVTADFVYLRLRKSEYSQEEQQAVEKKIISYLGEGKRVYALYKHEDDPAGAIAAVRLLESIGRSLQ